MRLNPWEQRWQHWLDQRLPAKNQRTLAQRSIFIIPSGSGLALLVVLGLLMILGINFQNSLVYVVCFWLLALFILNILYTYRNLAGVTIKALRIEPCFAGSHAVLELELSRMPTRAHWNIVLDWSKQDHVLVELASCQSVRIQLSHLATKRGYFEPPRIKISTTYPTGLALAWSYFTPDLKGLVYPEPLQQDSALAHQGNTDNSGKILTAGGSDFNELRAYKTGDPIQRIHWAKYAQTGQLYTKSFVDYASEALWLDWNQVPTPRTEQRLSVLCAQVLELNATQAVFGLKIPGKTIEPASGEVHYEQCLKALALYGLPYE
ncbi:DUF58 domain-containing protein [Thiofilum flexile]|uniref:DUF58 domain-containing protein n=1 Tax=Thiofilum flexile TaxID=125627 RepID=UPI00035DD433|nr:DUF58 domain-containing protein [Thiofilum flexile]